MTMIQPSRNRNPPENLYNERANERGRKRNTQVEKPEWVCHFAIPSQMRELMTSGRRFAAASLSKYLCDKLELEEIQQGEVRWSCSRIQFSRRHFLVEVDSDVEDVLSEANLLDSFLEFALRLDLHGLRDGFPLLKVARDRAGCHTSNNFWSDR